MTEPSPLALAVLFIGLVAVATAPVRIALRRIGVPDVVGYLAIGLGIATADAGLSFLTSAARNGLDTLAAAGLVILLFRVGLESHPQKLVAQLPRASLALVGNIAASAALGFIVAHYLIGTGPLPAAFVAVALSATSVGVSLAIWREEGAIDTDDGALLLDLAELDDLAAVLLLAMLLALAPVIQGLSNGSSVAEILALAVWLLIKLAGFAAACLVFAHYVEARFTGWLNRFDTLAGSIVPVAGIGFVIAALAELLGFSLAIGALFAGLAFSRDPKRVRLDRAFETLFRFFVPFFFVGIGLHVAIDMVGTSVALGGTLLVVAVVAKVAGTAVPLAATAGGAGAVLIGASMVPRAEIAMIVMERGRALGDWAVPPELYGAMVFVSLATCLITPPAVRYLLRRQTARMRPEP